MIAALRTELRKVSTTRTWWLTALVMFGYMIVMGVIMAFSLVLGMREAEKAGAPPAGGSGFGNAVLDEMAIATSVYTLAVALGHFLSADDSPWELLMTTGLIYALPPAAIYYTFKRYMVGGLTAGAVKS